MSIYLKRRQWKFYFLVFATIIVTGSLLYTHRLAKHLAIEERKKVELWAEGLKLLNLNPDQDITLITKILENNTTIPVILVDDRDSIIDFQNIPVPRKNAKAHLQKQLAVMQQKEYFIPIELVNGKNYVYFNDSSLLIQLSYYPYVQFGLITLFIVIAYFAFSYSRRAEQNQVWVGMSKETAHQLGTPISSLMAWMELLKLKNVDSHLINEMGKDVDRLRVITERFSKIGSAPILKLQPVDKTLNRIVDYLKNRSSEKIDFKVDYKSDKIPDIPLNQELFEWVIENICKNAMDAMNGTGTLHIIVTNQPDYLAIDISDTGKGIARKNFKTIFKPGFTTKKRGWGLGLPLAKRIIENYHSGKIFVRNSEINKGSVFRILLRKTLKSF